VERVRVALHPQWDTPSIRTKKIKALKAKITRSKETMEESRAIALFSE
jgi:hypothetical protein